MDTSGFLIVLFVVGVLAAWSITNASSKKNEKAFWAERAKDPHPPAHGMADNQPSTGASALSWVVLLIFAVAMVYVFNH